MARNQKITRHRVVQIFFYSALTGVITGTLIYFFKMLANFLGDQSYCLYMFVRENLIYLPLFIIGLTIIGILIALVVKIEPNAKGGGIGRASIILKGLITFKWLRLLVTTLVSSLLGFLGGLPMGVEGPSVIMGTSIGDGIYKLSKKKPGFRRYILTGGTSAGFTIATNSILAGIVFVLEEMHKRFSFMLVMIVFTASTFAKAVVNFFDYIFKIDSTFFPIGDIIALPLAYFYYVIIIGLVAGVMGKVFNQLIFTFSNIMQKLKIKKVYIIILNLLFVGLCGLLVIQVIGSGHNLILDIFANRLNLGLLIVILFLKIILIAITINTGTTGGMFIPVLVVGSILGGILGKSFTLLGLNSDYEKAIVFLTMAAFFASSMNTPITTIVFMIEASSNVNNIFFLVFVVLITYVMNHIIPNEALNEVIANNILKREDNKKDIGIYELNCEIQDNAFVIGQQTRDILWPANFLIKTISRCNSEKIRMVKGGDKFLNAKDQINAQLQTANLEQSLLELQSLIGEQKIEVSKVF